jgi:hypothetical protein
MVPNELPENRSQSSSRTGIHSYIFICNLYTSITAMTMYSTCFAFGRTFRLLIITVLSDHQTVSAIARLAVRTNEQSYRYDPLGGLESFFSLLPHSIQAFGHTSPKEHLEKLSISIGFSLHA